MTDYDFPALGFDPAPGNLERLRSTTETTRQYADTLGRHRDGMQRLHTDSWKGGAAEAFRSQAKDLPRDLGRAHDAHRAVADALGTYLEALTNGTQRGRDLEQQAAEALRRQQNAQQTASQLGSMQVATDDPRRPQLEAQYAQAGRDAQQFADQLAQLRAQAKTLFGTMQQEADRAAQRVQTASDAPYEVPAWWQRALDAVKNWIRKNANVLKGISNTLKWVSAVAALLSFIPVVGVVFAGIAMTAAVVALGIDIAVKAATGKGSWKAIALDAALTFVPAGRLLKLAGKQLTRAATAVAPGLVKQVTPLVVNAAKQVGKAQEAIRRPVHAAASKLFDAITPLGRGQVAAGKWLNSLPRAELSAAQRAELAAIGNNTGLTAAQKVRQLEQKQADMWRVGQHHTSNAPTQAELAADRELNKRWQARFKDRANQNLNDGLEKNVPALQGVRSEVGGEASRARMADGYNPRDGSGKTWEWSHEPIPDRSGGSALVPRRPLDHALLDPDRWRTTVRATKEWGTNGRFAPVPDSFWADQATPVPAGVP